MSITQLILNCPLWVVFELVRGCIPDGEECVGRVGQETCKEQWDGR